MTAATAAHKEPDMDRNSLSTRPSDRQRQQPRSNDRSASAPANSATSAAPALATPAIANAATGGVAAACVESRGLFAPADAGSITVDGSLTLARHANENESLSVNMGLDPERGPVSGLHIRGDLLLGHTPHSLPDEACAFLAVAGGARRSAPPALRVDGAVQSPPRADMLFVLRGSVSAGMFVLWSGHLLGDGTLRLHDGARAMPDRAMTACPTGAPHAGAIGAFLGPNFTLEPFGCDAVSATHANHRLPREAEYATIDFDMGVVLQRSTLRLRIGAVGWDGRRNDALLVGGTLHLGRSTLEVRSAFLSLPREVKPGDAFVLVEAGSICGELARLDTPRLPRGLRFQLERTSTTISLRVVRG